MESLEYIKKEQELDKNKDIIAQKVGYKLLEIFNLMHQYEQIEKEFQEWVKENEQAQ